MLGRLNLQSLAIRLGAGDLVVDLRGMPGKSYSVSVQAGAGDTTIRLPASVGISASTAGPLGTQRQRPRETRRSWINPRAEGSSVTIVCECNDAIGDLSSCP